MTVDPGLGGTGWALWDIQDWKTPTPPMATGCIHAPPNFDWGTRADIIVMQFQALLNEYRSNRHLIRRVWIEYPLLMQTGAGMASAIKGDVFKLMFLVGRLAQATVDHPSEFTPLEVNRWKGNLPKNAVARRVARALSTLENAYPNHTMDAVGMGVYLKGFMNLSGQLRSK